MLSGEINKLRTYAARICISFLWISFYFMVDKENCTAGERACSAGDVTKLLRVFRQSAITIATRTTRSRPSASKFHLSRIDKLLVCIRCWNCILHSKCRFIQGRRQGAAFSKNMREANMAIVYV